MGIRMGQKAVYAATAAIVLAMVGGYALATFSTGGTNSVGQGSQTTTVTAVQGLSWTSTSLVELATATVPAGTTCTSAAPCSVSTAGASDCAGGYTGSTTCAVGDFVEQVTLSTVANTAFTGTVQITLTVTGTSGTSSGTTFYYTQSSTTNSVQTIVQDFDIGTSASGPGNVASVTVVATG
jgi:hypothetical protein